MREESKCCSRSTLVATAWKVHVSATLRSLERYMRLFDGLKPHLGWTLSTKVMKTFVSLHNDQQTPHLHGDICYYNFKNFCMLDRNDSNEFW